MHYTLSKGWSEQGANLIGNFNSSIGDTSTYNNTQDFFDPYIDADYSPLIGEVRHRVTSTVVYDLPWLVDRQDVVGSVFGGWQLSSVLNFRSGEPLRITQASGIANSRPDYNGGNQIFDDWRDTLQYLDRSAYTLVPTSATTGATIRPGNQNSSDVRGPGRRRVDLTFAKTFTLRGTSQIQFRFESFNVFNWRQLNNPSHQRHGADVRADYERGIDENGADRVAVYVLIWKDGQKIRRLGDQEGSFSEEISPDLLDLLFRPFSARQAPTSATARSAAPRRSRDRSQDRCGMSAPRPFRFQARRENPRIDA